MPYMPHHYMPPAAHQVLPDRNTLDTFEKHWKYYLKNPPLFEQLRIQNPAQFESLNNYYRMYGEYLGLANIIPVVKQEEPSSSRASVHSGQSSDSAMVDNRSKMSGYEQQQQLSQSANNFQPIDPADSNLQEGVPNNSTILTDPDADPRFQPTFVNNESVVVDRLTPKLFSTCHVKATFGPLGLMAKVDAKSPLEGQSATVELHSIRSLLQAQAKEYQSYPGPLIPGTTHKGEVIQFCQMKIQKAHNNASITDKDSYILLWELLVLLLRQKNAIDGSDIAELLMKGREVANSFDDQEENDATTEIAADGSNIRHDKTVILTSAQATEKVTRRFRDYLTFGHKKEGLEYAMKHGLWGHALFLASKMDERSYSNVMLRFANGLAVNDPLQTLYQLMSGRQPIAVKECADKSWGDWRPHLAMILSNPSGKEGLDRRSIVTLGDTLLEKGFLYAAHFCYLMANIEFGGFSNPQSKLVLIGSDKTLGFDAFATNEAIQCTEIFEYIQKLSNPESAMMSLQYFKFVYAIRLIDSGLPSKALDYLEQIAISITRHNQFLVADQLDLVDFVTQVQNLADRLKYLDPMYTTREGEVSEMGDPAWLTSFRSTVLTFSEGNFHNNDANGQGYEHEQLGYYQDYGQQGYDSYYSSQQPSTEPSDYYDGAQDPITMKAIPEETVDHSTTDVGEENQKQNQPETPETSVPSIPTIPVPTLPVQTDITSQPPPQIGLPPPPSAVAPSLPPISQPPQPEKAKPNNYFDNIRKPAGPMPNTSVPKNESKPSPATGGDKKPIKANDKKQEGPGILGRFLGRFIKPSNQAHLPDDKNQDIVWDEDKKRWIDKNADPEEENSLAVAPPSDMELSRTNTSTDIANSSGSNPPMPGMLPGQGAPPPPMMGGNKYAGSLAKKRGGLAGRIDVFKNSQSAPVLAPADAPAPLLPPIEPMSNTMVPSMMPIQAPVDSNGGGDVPAAPEEEANAAPPMFFNPNNFSAVGGVPGK